MLEEPRMNEQGDIAEVLTHLIGVTCTLSELQQCLRAGRWTLESVRMAREYCFQALSLVRHVRDLAENLPVRASDGTTVWEDDAEAAVTNDPQLSLEDVAEKHGSFLTGLEMAAGRCGASPWTSGLAGEGRPTADRTSEAFRTQVVTERPEVGSVTYLRRETEAETARREQRQKEERARLAKLRKPTSRRRKWTGRR